MDGICDTCQALAFSLRLSSSSADAGHLLVKRGRVWKQNLSNLSICLFINYLSLLSLQKTLDLAPLVAGPAANILDSFTIIKIVQSVQLDGFNNQGQMGSSVFGYNRGRRVALLCGCRLLGDITSV
jgi:hypothetical protein